jgi:hypothetical protein
MPWKAEKTRLCHDLHEVFEDYCGLGWSPADVAHMADDLSHLPFAVVLSRRTSRIIRQNLWFSPGGGMFPVPAIIAGLKMGELEPVFWEAPFQVGMEDRGVRVFLPSWRRLPRACRVPAADGEVGCPARPSRWPVRRMKRSPQAPLAENSIPTPGMKKGSKSFTTQGPFHFRPPARVRTSWRRMDSRCGGPSSARRSGGTPGADVRW